MSVRPHLSTDTHIDIAGVRVRTLLLGPAGAVYETPAAADREAVAGSLRTEGHIGMDESRAAALLSLADLPVDCCLPGRGEPASR